MLDIVQDKKSNLYFLHPELVNRIRGLVIEMSNLGHVIDIVQGYRSFEEQNKLFLKRPKVTNAKGGFSWHNYGLAVDFAFRDKNGKINFSESNPWDKMGEIGIKNGLEWGGDWVKFKDRPHFQITGKLSIRNALRLYQQGGIGLVWNEVNKLLGI